MLAIVGFNSRSGEINFLCSKLFCAAWTRTMFMCRRSPREKKLCKSLCSYVAGQNSNCYFFVRVLVLLVTFSAFLCMLERLIRLRRLYWLVCNAISVWACVCTRRFRFQCYFLSFIFSLQYNNSSPTKMELKSSAMFIVFFFNESRTHNTPLSKKWDFFFII